MKDPTNKKRAQQEQRRLKWVQRLSWGTFVMAFTAFFSLWHFMSSQGSVKAAVPDTMQGSSQSNSQSNGGLGSDQDNAQGSAGSTQDQGGVVGSAGIDQSQNTPDVVSGAS